MDSLWKAYVTWQDYAVKLVYVGDIIPPNIKFNAEFALKWGMVGFEKDQFFCNVWKKVSLWIFSTFWKWLASIAFNSAFWWKVAKKI